MRTELVTLRDPRPAGLRSSGPPNPTPWNRGRAVPTISGYPQRQSPCPAAVALPRARRDVESARDESAVGLLA